MLPYYSSLVTKPHQIRLSQVCNGNCTLIQQWPVLMAQTFQNTYLNQWIMGTFGMTRTKQIILYIFPQDTSHLSSTDFPYTPYLDKSWWHTFISKYLQNYYCAFLMPSMKLKWPLKYTIHQCTMAIPHTCSSASTQNVTQENYCRRHQTGENTIWQFIIKYITETESMPNHIQGNAFPAQLLRHLQFSRWCCLRCKSSGMLRCVNWQPADGKVLKQHNAFIFSVKQST